MAISTNHRIRRITGWVALLLSLVQPALAGHPKTDSVYLYNGDKLTGEIRGMTAGKLEFKPYYADAVFITWRDVATLDSRYNYELRLDSGERLYGNVARSEDNGYLNLTSIDKSAAVALLDVTEIRVIEATLEERVDLRIDATMYLDPSIQTVSLSGSVAYEDEGRRSSIRALQNNNQRQTSDDTTTTEASDSNTNIDVQIQRWTDRQRAFRVFLGNYSQNTALGNEGRVTAGVGAGRYFIDTQGSQLTGAAGLQVVNERLLTSGPTENADDSVENSTNVEAFIGGYWHIYRFTDLDMDITLNGNVYPSLSDWGRRRGNLQVNIDWELVNSVYWTVQFWGEYDSDADKAIGEIEGFGDYQLTTGVSWRP